MSRDTTELRRDIENLDRFIAEMRKNIENIDAIRAKKVRELAATFAVLKPGQWVRYKRQARSGIDSIYLITGANMDCVGKPDEFYWHVGRFLKSDGHLVGEHMEVCLGPLDDLEVIERPAHYVPESA